MEAVLARWQYRVIFRIVSLSEHAAILVGSVYLATGLGMTGETLELLEYLAGVALASPWPFVLGGDWNVDPEHLLDVGWLELVHGSLRSPIEDTCGDSIRDCFVV